MIAWCLITPVVERQLREYYVWPKDMSGLAQLPKLNDDIIVPRLCESLGNHRKVWVAYSGGLDSTALLLGAHAASLATQCDLQIVHINHGLSEHSEAWASHCQRLADQLGRALHLYHVELSKQGNLEANARAARYEIFADLLGSGELLWLGHHQQDQTETLLYRMFSGRGLIPMRDRGVLGQGMFERPLLGLSRQQLLRYVQTTGIDWIEDESNQDLRLQRNFLRHEVIPGLQSVWRNLHQALLRVAGEQHAIQAALDHALSSSGASFASTDLPQQKDSARVWLRSFLRNQGEYEVTDKSLDEFLRQLEHSSAGLLRAQHGQLLSYQEQIHYEPDPAYAIPDESVSLASGHRDVVNWGYGQLEVKPAQRSDTHAVPWVPGLQLRKRVGGERLKISSERPSQSVKALLGQAQVLPWRRVDYPLVYLHEELIGVPGVAVKAVDDVLSSAMQSADTCPYCCIDWLDSLSAE